MLVLVSIWRILAIPLKFQITNPTGLMLDEPGRNGEPNARACNPLTFYEFPLLIGETH